MRRLRAALRIRPGEERLAVRLLAMMLVGMAGAAIGANGVESLFFARFGPEYLPFLYLALGPLTFAVMAGMSTRLSGHAARFLSRLPLALAVALLAARGALLLEVRWLYPALWLVMMVAWTCQVMGSWGLAGAVSDTRQAKRLFPLYGAGLITGGVLGGLATGPIARLIHAENLLLVWAGTLLVMHTLARGLAAARTRRTRRRGPGILRQLAEGFEDVWSWPLLRWMSVSLVLFAVLYFTLALLFAQAATARYPRADELAGFLGLFMGAANGAALLVSLVVANRLFARFGLPAMVMGLAAIYVLGFVGLAVSGSFGAVVAFRLVQMVWVNGVWATGWQALFNVVPPERRARTRTFMDAGPLQAGIVLAGGLLLLADRVLRPAHLATVGAVAGALALGAMWRARRAYGGALVEALRTGNPDVFRPDEEPFGGFRDDADARQAVRAGVGDPDPATRRISTAILSGLAVPEDVPALNGALADDDPHVRSAAVQGLARVGASAESVGGLLEDPDPVVRATAAAAAGEEAAAEATLTAMARDPRPEWRAASAAASGSSGRVADLEALLADREPEVRSAAAEALASVPAELAVRPLAAALGDPDAAVRSAAASALASIGMPAEGALLAALHEPASRAAALGALAAIDGPPPPALIAFAHDRAERAARYHHLWLRLRPGRNDRLDLLAAGLRHRATTLGLEALHAVARSGDAEAMAVAAENLAGSDPQQRANALETVEALGRPDVVRPLLALWDGSSPVGGGEAEAVEELLGDDDPWLRACAALAAGALDRADLRPALEQLRHDADGLVRQAVTVALEPVETLSTLSLLERVMFLSKVRLFADLPPEDLKHVAEVASEHAFPDGEVIAEQDEPGDEMHVVVAGEIRVLVGRDGGPPAEVARRAAGETVGEMAILGEETRMASLVCAGPVRTLALDRRSFRRILRERPDVSLAVMRVLSERLRQAHGEP